MRVVRKHHLVPLLVLLLPLLPALPAGAEEKGAEEKGAEEAAYVGNETCLGCHGDLKEAYDRTVHARIGMSPRTEAQKNTCEACHGPGSVHVSGPAKDNIRTFDPAQKKENPRDWNAACLACHERGERAHWKGSPHAVRGVACVSCHEVMKKVSDRGMLKKATASETCYGCHLIRQAQNYRSSHMPVREGKMDCLSCHNPHGTIGPSLLATATVNENCYKCHAEKRGPFLWEHAPVRESCSNCHEPHGSIYGKLLVRDTPRLCMQCHNASRHPTTPRNKDSRFVFNQACLNCHPAVHGSNHAAGVHFQR